MNLSQSIKIVNSNALFIPFLALSGIMIMPSPISFLIILSFILYPAVYGHLVEATMNKPKTSWVDLLKTHWANYLCVTIVLGIPVMVLSYFYDDMGYIQKTTIDNLNGFIINCLAIYIWPLVFLRKKIKDPIVQGISTTLTNIKVSIPLIALTFVIFTVKFLAKLSLIMLLPLTTLKAFLVGFAQNVITVYLGLIIFTAATIFLKDKNELTSNHLMERNAE